MGENFCVQFVKELGRKLVLYVKELVCLWDGLAHHALAASGFVFGVPVRQLAQSVMVAAVIG